MKNLFIVAHPDDEAYGPYGTILNLIHDKEEVLIFCLCKGTRPGNEHVSDSRIESFKKNCQNSGVDYILGNNLDLMLDPYKVTKEIVDLVNFYKPSTIYTHSMSDLNRDHRIVSEAALVAGRPKLNSSINEFYFFETPSSTDWSFNKIQPSFQPNNYREINEEILNLKIEALSNYDTEVYDYPDARSIEFMISLSKYRGGQVGFKHAEAFQLVFSLNKKIKK